MVSRYDAEGLRCEIEENEKLTKFIFHKENVLVETDKDNNPISRFTRGYEIVSADIKSNSPTNCNLQCTHESVDDLERYFYTTEEQGSTTLITNTTANVCNEYFYDAFGNVLDSREEVHNRITYVGQQFDGVKES